ncbi:MAG: hypothetical protein AAGI50_03210 [Pseudomonadota bacterium]
MAILSHQHPDHWAGAPALPGFATVPAIGDGRRPEATGGDWPKPRNVLDGPNVAPEPK